MIFKTASALEALDRKDLTSMFYRAASRLGHVECGSAEHYEAIVVMHNVQRAMARRM